MWRSPLIVLHFRRLSLMRFSQEVKATLWEIIDEMANNVSDYCVHPEKDFSRKKKWDFPALVKFIISMEDQSLKTNFINTLVTHLIALQMLLLTKEEYRLILMHLNIFLIL